MIPDKYVEIIALALVGGFFCVLIPTLMIMRNRATRGLRLLLIENPASEGMQAALVRKRRIDRVLSVCLFAAVAFVLFGMIFGGAIRGLGHRRHVSEG
jgi:hypothetical protein